MTNKISLRKITKSMALIVAGGLSLVLLGVGAVYLSAFILGPPDLNNEQNTVYYNDEGQVFGEEKGSENRYQVTLDEMSPYLIDATLMIEDKRFYEHHGLDMTRIIGAAINDLKHWSLREGASTLTQQYARNLFLSHEKTWTRKIKEAFYAIRIELFYSKQDILTGYLNTIYYGHGAYGVEAASNVYFNKPSSELTLAEAAMLAGIPKGPAYFSPLTHPENAFNRQQQILKVMLHYDKITEDQYVEAKDEQLQLADMDAKTDQEVGPYYQDVVLEEAAQILNLDLEHVRSGGFEIYTTLNTSMQQTLEKQMTNHLNADSDVEAGAIMMKPDDGAIQALVGGRDYEKSSFNRAVHAKRMPGSAIKPFLYYAALEKGYTPSTMIESKPTAFELSNGETYQPGNYNGYYADGPITLAQALALSDNIYAVKTHLYLGTETLAQTLKDFGMTGDFPAVASLALGTAEVTMEDIVKGYAVIANGGHDIDGYTIDKIVDRSGHEIYSRPTPEANDILDPRSTFILTDLLTGMFDEELNGYTSVTGAPITDQLTHTFAGKSGTTASDSWMIGYSPESVTGVWIGYDDNRPMETVSETSAAKEIWANVMEETASDEPVHFEVPSGVVGIPIDPETGARATPYCETSRVMYFKEGDEPDDYCDLHFHQPEKPLHPAEDEEEQGIFDKWWDFFNGR